MVIRVDRSCLFYRLYPITPIASLKQSIVGFNHDLHFAGQPIGMVRDFKAAI